MANSTVVKTYLQGVTEFWSGAIQRWDDARGLAEQGKYEADNLASDVAWFWFKGIDSWLSPLPAVGDPTLPTIYIDSPAAGSKNQVGTAYLPAPVPLGAVIAVTTLYRLGSTADTLPATAAIDAADPTLLKVTLTAAGPNAGLYQGLVHVGAAAKPLAVVLVHLT